MKMFSLNFEYDEKTFVDKSVIMEFLKRIDTLCIENPTKTNLKRKEFVKQILSGKDCKEICKSLNINTDPHRYLCKTLRRYCEYVGMHDVYISVKDLRMCT